MKHKIFTLKSSLLAFALALILLGGISLPDITPDTPEALPIEAESSGQEDEDDGMRPMSDLDEPTLQIKKD